MGESPAGRGIVPIGGRRLRDPAAVAYRVSVGSQAWGGADHARVVAIQAVNRACAGPLMVR